MTACMIDEQKCGCHHQLSGKRAGGRSDHPIPETTGSTSSGTAEGILCDHPVASSYHKVLGRRSTPYLSYETSKLPANCAKWGIKRKHMETGVVLCFLRDSIKPKVCGHCPRAPAGVPGPPWTSGRAACLPDYSGSDVVSVWRGHVPPGTFYLPSVCSHGCRYPGACCAVRIVPFLAWRHAEVNRQAALDQETLESKGDIGFPVSAKDPDAGHKFSASNHDLPEVSIYAVMPEVGEEGRSVTVTLKLSRPLRQMRNIAILGDSSPTVTTARCASRAGSLFGIPTMIT